MRKGLISLSLLLCISVHSESMSGTEEMMLLEKDRKLEVCIDDYVKKQSKSYSKIVQSNLYDLIHNFDRIISKLSGKKLPEDDVTYNEKVDELAKIQCNAYYETGILK